MNLDFKSNKSKDEYKITLFRMEEFDNPFEESINSNMIIKVKDVDIFINKNILQSCEAQSTKVEKDESVAIKTINGKEWSIKIIDNYSAEILIRFFKFIVPGFIIQLNGKRMIKPHSIFVFILQTM